MPILNCKANKVIVIVIVIVMVPVLWYDMDATMFSGKFVPQT